jgi:hypothetical protein
MRRWGLNSTAQRPPPGITADQRRGFYILSAAMIVFVAAVVVRWLGVTGPPREPRSTPRPWQWNTLLPASVALSARLSWHLATTVSITLGEAE